MILGVNPKHDVQWLSIWEPDWQLLEGIWLAGCHWLAGWLLAGWLAAGWLAGCWLGWLAGWLAWLAGRWRSGRIFIEKPSNY